MSLRPLAFRGLASLPWLLLLGGLAVSLYYSRIGWHQPLLDSWSFRQTQTAISTRYLLEDGFRLAYQTPVLGAPWSLPYEFPTYQFCVAAMVKLTGMPLDSAGRLVSLLFAYGAFSLLGCWVARATGSRPAGIYTVVLALVSPVYLFGSRAFLIESTALFFTLGMLVATQHAVKRPTGMALVWLALTATLAGLTKATTYAVGLVGVAGTLALEYESLHARWKIQPDRWRQLARLAAALLVPFALTLAWTYHTDVVKARNELAVFTTSTALHEWNYGTWAQRFSFATWDKFFLWINHFVLGMPLVWIVVLAVLAAAGALPRMVWVALAMLLTGWLVFTNLYLVHEHYYYASGVYLLAVVGMALGALADLGTARARLGAALAATACAGMMLWGYVERTLPEQKLTQFPLLETARVVGKLTPPDSVIVTYGYDWESSLPYYAHRRALMWRAMPAGDDPEVQRALKRLDRPVGGIVFRRPGVADYTRFEIEQLEKYGLGRQRVYSSADADLFLARDPPEIADEVWRRAGFAGKPDLIESALPFVELLVGNRSAMLAHAPGQLILRRTPEQRELRCEFALADNAYTNGGETDGVAFVAEFENDARQIVRLFERRLDPRRTTADRGWQSVTIPLPAGQPGLLHLRTVPGSNNAFDWSVWRGVRLE